MVVAFEMIVEKKTMAYCIIGLNCHLTLVNLLDVGCVIYSVG
jgi:hypothetical protein